MEILIIIRKGYKSQKIVVKYTFDQDDGTLVRFPRILHKMNKVGYIYIGIV